MAKLIITRGLQGSGKTTRAKAWVAEDPTHRARVNRDDLRRMVHNGFWDGDNTEKLIVRLRDVMIKTALKMGQDVVSDDTNLPSRTVRDLIKLAELSGAEYEIWDMTDVPVEVCIERDAQRVWPEYIGEKVIRKRYEQFVKGRPYPLPLGDAPEAKSTDVNPYVPNPEFPEAVIVDIDGTVAHMAGRSPYDETRVHEDTPNQPVIDMIKRLHKGGVKIIFCSGRTDKCYGPTHSWIRKRMDFIDNDFVLLMRKAGDQRKDSIVKREIFEQYLRNAKLNFVGVFDDRNQVVKMWRDELGLTVFQVADGDF